MPVIFPVVDVPDSRRIIRMMTKLKTQRYTREISRAKFLAEYEVLRNALHETEEYKALRRKVIARSEGVCEKCEKAPGDQMCHKIGVAFRPDLALRMDNVYWGCGPCHQLDHPDMQLVR